MSRRCRSSKAQLHVHCESCYSRRCRTRVEVSVSCAVIPCRLQCGALFHLCKEEDHLLLCPNARVPCLNAEYGCPIHMPRSLQAAHLQVCPASVVCCSMEWNRWPAEDAHVYPTTELHENLLKDDGGRGECLDLTMALRDQDHLFHSLKMEKLFPELIQRVTEEELEEERRAEEERKEKAAKKRAALEREIAEWSAYKNHHTWEPMTLYGTIPTNETEMEAKVELEPEMETERGPLIEPSQEEREAIAWASEVDAEVLQNYSSWEHMFSMERGGCREAGLAAAAGKKGQGKDKGKEQRLGTVVEEDTDTGAGATASNTCMDACKQAMSTTSLTKDPMKTFVYGHVEPMKIITVRTFAIPTSFQAKQGRIRNPGFYKRKSVLVDTSDLGVAFQDMPIWEEVQASLLCSLEKELRGHLIAESSCSDNLLQDEGTQTYNFLSAPFRCDTSLADLTVDKPQQLHLQLQVESVTSRHHKASSTFTFLCGHTFQRREFAKHFRNVHSDIQMSVNGWFVQRCPLAYLGCTYSQRRFQPSTHKATVTYNQELSCYSLRPTLSTSLGEGSQQPQRSSAEEPSSATTTQKRGGGKGGGGGGEDSLSALPYEVLCHVASFLDSLSLSQLALVSRLMRDACSSLLQDRGIVTLRWDRQTDSHGGAKWMVKQTVWQFSTLFSPVDRWCFQDVPSMAEHLKVCPYYQRESRTERILLPRIRKETHKHCKGPALVNLLQRKTIM